MIGFRMKMIARLAKSSTARTRTAANEASERALRAAAQSDPPPFLTREPVLRCKGLMSRTSLWRGRAWGAPGQVSPDIGANRPEMNRPYGLLRMSEKWNWMMFNAE